MYCCLLTNHDFAQACFPALAGNGRLIPTAKRRKKSNYFPALGWHWLQFLPPFTLVTCFPAFDTDYTVASSSDCPFLYLRLL